MAEKERPDDDAVHHKHAGILLGFRFITNLMKAEVKRLQKKGKRCGKETGQAR